MASWALTVSNKSGKDHKGENMELPYDPAIIVLGIKKWKPQTTQNNNKPQIQ